MSSRLPENHHVIPDVFAFRPQESCKAAGLHFNIDASQVRKLPTLLGSAVDCRFELLAYFRAALAAFDSSDDRYDAVAHRVNLLGLIDTTVRRMAAKETGESLSYTGEQPVLGNGESHVIRARRLESTAAAEPDRHHVLIETNKANNTGS